MGLSIITFILLSMHLTGIIKYYKEAEQWGKLLADGDEKEIFFHHTHVQGELLHLLRAGKYRGEPLYFRAEPNLKRPGDVVAADVRLNLFKRSVGFVELFESEGGYGKIITHPEKQSVFFHYSCLRKEGRQDKFVRVDVGTPVVFTLSRNTKGPIAEDVVLVNAGCLLENFAYFKDFGQSLRELEALAEPENWDFVLTPTDHKPVLFSYLNQTFRQVEQQGKIIEGYSSKEERKYAYFNTGLVTPEQQDIYAYFVQNLRYRPFTGWGLPEPQWIFREFNTDQSLYRRFFPAPADIPTYFNEADAAELIFNTSLGGGEIILMKEHLKKRKFRFEAPEIKALSDDAFIEAIENAVRLAKKRIRRNYKIAIPHYYEGKIQFLLPLCIRSKVVADAALVVNKEDNIYRAYTILNLDQAYTHARLLAKPDREWLLP